MAENDQRSGTDRRSADGRSGFHTGFSLGRTALTGWALAAVIGLAGFGTALDVTPVRVADSAPLGAVGTVVRGSAPAVDPRTPVQVGRGIGPVAVAGGTLPLGVVGPMDTVTAASVPTPATAPTNTAPAPGLTDLSVGGPVPTTAATAPGGPAAQLRQAAFTAAAPDQRAGLAIRTALAQIGLPYVWGGDGPTNGDAGFDCSGLTTFSYGSAGVLLPRTAHTQYNAGPHVPGGAPLQPGDLVFYGTSARVHHVGMYLGAGRMVNAPTFGKPVQVAFYRYRGDDYLGATRPAAAGGSLTTGVLPYVDPLPAVPDVALAPAQQQQQAQERVFQAPVASLPAVLPQPGDAALPPEPQSAAQSIAESEAVTVRVVPRAVVAPAPQNAPAGTAPSGQASVPVAGTTTSSSAPVTSSPTAPPTSAAAAPAGNTTAPGPSAPVPSNPAGSASSTTAAPAVPASPPTTQSPTTQSPTTQPPTTVVEKATGSTTATTTLAPTSAVRTTTPKAPTSKVATPVAPKTTTPSAVKTVTSPSTTAKAVTTTSKPAATTEDDDPTTTKTSASKTSSTKTTEQKTSAKKTTEEKTSAKKTTEEESSSSDEDD